MEIAGIDPELVARVERETTALLGALIRIDTSNPPGNESAVAAFLDDYFRRHGLQGEIVGEPAERRSFVASLAGSRDICSSEMSLDLASGCFGATATHIS